MTLHVNAAGLESHYEYDRYDKAGKVIRNYTNLGEEWHFSYHSGYTEVRDVLGRSTQYHYDHNHELIKKVRTDGRFSETVRDELGRVVKQRDVMGRETSYRYNAVGQVSEVTRADGAVLRYNYDRNNRLINQTDGVGRTTTYAYDDRGNLILQTNVAGESTEYGYTEQGLLTQVKDPLGNLTHYAYDERSRLINITDCSGYSTRLRYGEESQLVEVENAQGDKICYRYDDYGRLLETVYPDGAKVGYEYDSADRLRRYTDAGGGQTSYEYDVDNLPLKRINGLGHSFGYQYDRARRLIGLTNENQSRYNFSYNELDKLTQEVGFDGKLTTYAYDDIGQLTTQTEYGMIANKGHLTTTQPEGQSLRISRFERDTLGRVRCLSTLNPQTQAQQQVYYEYDESGQLLSLTDGDSHIRFGYDRLGRITTQQSHDDRLSYHYDANGNRTGLTLPNGDRVNYLYYGSGHLSAIKYNDSLISEFERNRLHQEVSRSQGVLRTDYRLDPMGRLVEQRSMISYHSNPREEDYLLTRHYRYDLNGNLIQSRDKRMASEHYHYDKLGRLTATNREVFAFDPAHNIIEVEYSDIERRGNRRNDKIADNRIVAYQGVDYEYDGLGNLTKRHDRISGEVQSYVYDLHDRLICARISRRNKETEEWHYRYDVLGRRIEKVRSKNGEFLSETKTQFIWDGSHLVQEINHKTDRTFSYIYSHPNSYEPLAQICTGYTDEGTQSETNAQHIHYFHCDQIGAPREMTDEAGNLLWYADYKGWGGIREAHNLKDAHQPFRLQNQYVDEETGLHYNFFRYYDPHIGRFTQQDPIGLAGGMNLYRFEGTVQNQVDPLGLFAPVLAAPWILEALAYATTAMTGILVGVGIMDAMEESEDSSDSSSTPITIGAEETNDIGKCPNKPKCPPDVYEKLNSAVEKAKDYTSSLGGCKGWMAEPALYVRRDAAYKELKARKLREDTCWNGGDSGHKERMQNLQNQIKNCEKFIGKGFR